MLLFLLWVTSSRFVGRGQGPRKKEATRPPFPSSLKTYNVPKVNSPDGSKAHVTFLSSRLLFCVVVDSRWKDEGNPPALEVCLEPPGDYLQLKKRTIYHQLPPLFPSYFQP